jgi:hypothetical protein
MMPACGMPCDGCDVLAELYQHQQLPWLALDHVVDHAVV